MVEQNEDTTPTAVLIGYLAVVAFGLTLWLVSSPPEMPPRYCGWSIPSMMDICPPVKP